MSTLREATTVFRPRRVHAAALVLIAVITAAAATVAGPAPLARAAVPPAPGPGVITTVAGNGTWTGDTGDGGPAVGAELDAKAVTADAAGNLYITSSEEVRRVDHETGIITTVAGNGTQGFSGDDGPATDAELSHPWGVAVGANGDLYIVDGENERIRRVDHLTGNISTVAGNGTQGETGDGGPATDAAFDFSVSGIALDSAGDIYVADSLNSRVRRIDHATGIVTTVAGTATSGFSGDDGPAVDAELRVPFGVAVDDSGDVYIADTANARIRRVDSKTGVITTVAGNGTTGFSGDGGPAIDAELNSPLGLGFDPQGDLLIADSMNNRVRAFDPASGMITTIAGSGQAGFSGDGGPALIAMLDQPTAVSADAAGDVFLADIENSRIREVGHASPSAPTDAAALPGNGRARVTWAPPAEPGSGAVTQYVVTASPGGASKTVDGSLLQADITGLANGTPYTFTITAVNGTGPGSETSAGPVTPTVESDFGTGKFIYAAYVDFFNRFPNESELNFWYHYLEGGGTHLGFVTALANSPEWVSHIVTGFYYDTLGRAPDSAGLQYWENQIISGAQPVAQVAAQFYSSDEYYALYGHSELSTWVTDLYHKVLHREPDAGGLQAWVASAQSYGRGSVALNFYQSPESLHDRVTVLYEELLQRDPDPSGLNYWPGVVATQGDVALAAFLAASDEYYGDATMRF